MKRFIALWMLVLVTSIYFPVQADQTHLAEQEELALISVDSQPVVENELIMTQVSTYFMEQDAEVVPGIVPNRENDFENLLYERISSAWLSLQLTTNVNVYLDNNLNTRDQRFLPKWLLRSPEGHQFEEIPLNSSLH